MSDDLSRLLDGELPPDEAAALRARIAVDPELAARWRRMQALPGAIAGLPREMGVPPNVRTTHVGHLGTLPTSIIGEPEPDHTSQPQLTLEGHVRPPAEALTTHVGHLAPRPTSVLAARRVLPLAGWLAAAALLVALLQPPPARVLVAGTEVVEGRVDVLAGDVVVEVDGKVSIRVEPPGGPLRGAGAEVTRMDKKSIAGALAGSVVTVTVIQGIAWLRPADAAAVEVRAGETRSVGTPGSAAPEERVVTHTGTAEESPADRVAALERELDRAKLERALAVGQLRRHEGVAQEWPTNLAPIWKPEGFEAFLRHRVAALPDAEIVAVDCEEYPCVALVRSHSTAEDWNDRLMPVHDDLEGAGFGDDLHVIGRGNHLQTDTADVRLYGFAVTPGGEVGEDLRQRVVFRTDAALEDAAAELMSQGGAAE